MALTDQEKQIIQFGKESGKSKLETQAALARFRKEEQTQLSTQSSQPNQAGFLEKSSNVLGSVFGGDKIGEAIGTQIARSRATEDEKQFIKGPSLKEVAGDVGRTALNFTPVGRATKAIGTGLTALGLRKGAQTVGGVVAGGATGAAFDVAEDVAEGREVGLGAGTVLGAGIPAATPVAAALTRASSKILGRGASEITGKLTGTSAETVEQAFDAARQGGKQLDEFTTSLRGQTTPEQLVNNVRENVSRVSQQRSALFAETLEELSDQVVTTAPAKTTFRETLESTGVTIGDDGLLDFTNSKLRTVPNAQTKLQQAWAEVSSMPDSMSLKELDTTRQAVKAIKEIAGDDPSSNLANMLIEDASRSVRTAGEQVPGYGKMLDNFAETSEFLTELEKGISAGDSKTVDQAFRRIATTLKTNNEQRMALVQELDAATDGALLSQIAGQQLSEALPRGLVGTYLAPVLGTTVATGVVTPAVLPGLLLASPRAVGEFARGLGLSAAKADQFIDAVAEAKSTLIKIGALSSAEVDNSSN